MVTNVIVVGYVAMMVTIVCVMIAGMAGFFWQWGQKADSVAFAICMFFGIVPGMVLLAFIILNQGCEWGK